MRTLLAFLLAFGLVTITSAAAPPARAPAEWQKLIDQLGDDDEDKRKEAAKKLEELGPDVLPALRAAAERHDDADVRLYARALVAVLKELFSSKARVLEGHSPWPMRVVLLSDGKHAISSGGNVMRLWDLQTGKLVRVITRSGGYALSVSKDGKRVATNYKGERVEVFDVGSGKLINTFPGHGNMVWAAALSPDGKNLFTGGNKVGQRLLDVDTANPAISGFTGAKDYCRCATWSADGKTIAVGHFSLGENKVNRGTLRLWDAKTGKELWQAKGHERPMTSVAFSPDGKRLVTASVDRTVRIWDAANGKELARMTLPALVAGAAFSHDGKRVVTAGSEEDVTVRVWDVTTKKELRRFDGHSGGSLGVVVTKDGKHALSWGKDKALRLWSMPQ